MLTQIAAELDVSVVPVREAVRMLESEGLVTFVRNVGAQVAAFDPAEYRDTMEALGLVEGYAIASAGPFLTAADIALARELNEELGESLRDFDPTNFTRLNYEFHRTLFKNCPNSHILEQVERGWNRLAVVRRSGFTFVPGRAQDSIIEHNQLLDLIESNAELHTVELVARNHRIAALDAYLTYQTRGRESDDPLSE